MKTVSAALLSAVAAAGFIYWRWQIDLAASRAEIERLSKAGPVAGAAPVVPSSSGAAEPATAVKTVERIVTVKEPGDAATRQELIRLLDEKNAKLSGMESSLREVRESLAEVEAKLTQATREKEQLAASQKDLERRLDTANRMAEAYGEQGRGREERLAQAEVSAQELRKRGEDSARKLAKLNELAAQMDDLSRRRDTYLNNVLRRFREATELFRTLALRIDDPNLARIQQTIGAADEDLRQIQALGAQAARLQKDQALARK